MRTKFLMTIDFIFKNDEKQKIVGGTNLKYSDESFHLLNIINKDVVMKTKNENFIFQVKNVDVFSSISGLLNVGLTLYDSKEFNFLSIGDEVYIISK